MKYLNLLSRCKLFFNFNNDEIENILKSLNYKIVNYNERNIIFSENSILNEFGIILNGQVEVLHITSNGDENLMDTLKEGNLICESAVFTNSKKLPFTIVAKTKCEILLINSSSIFNKNLTNKPFYTFLIQNYLNILAENNVKKAQKMNILSRRSTQDKVLTYLNFESKKQKSKTFCIEYNREELATFLAVDRSALSSVLSKLKKENVIDFHKNKFTLL